ncbi:unnamed protein product [Gongylonema pulchrum]|uniref:Glyco_transf_7N domain-containing protein n=1 Tax=Gongylonema pulchrum TaxID=637853 RepID=A0A183EBY7_9BILA|nr:unnamed protein product [Gongylonema pulchrum]
MILEFWSFCSGILGILFWNFGVLFIQYIYIYAILEFHGKKTAYITFIGTVVTTQLLLDSINVSLRMQPQNSSLEKCPTTPPGLVGPIKVWFDEPEFSEIEALYPHLEPGGHGKPKNCQAQHRVAIVVPYRDREVHLRIFLHNLHSLLSKQQLDYAIFIVEQHANETFNRAKLMNVGFAEAMKLYDWQCFIFHDVDLLPENDRNIYSCPEQPRHMSVAIDKFKYKLPYGSIFGGISAMTVEQFVKINGFSNDYWGWGGEDDDLSTRRYDLQLRPLFTHIKVELLEEESKENLRKQGFKKC